MSDQQPPAPSVCKTGCGEQAVVMGMCRECYRLDTLEWHRQHPRPNSGNRRLEWRVR